MDDPALLSVFGAALGLVAPWEVVSVEFDELLGRLEIGIDFPRGSRFACVGKENGHRLAFGRATPLVSSADCSLR
jgi:hypothetical protein